MTREIEFLIYIAAPSIEDYADKRTIKKRLRQLAKTIQNNVL